MILLLLVLLYYCQLLDKDTINRILFPSYLRWLLRQMTYQMNRRPEFARNWAKQIRLLFLLKSLPRVQNYGFEFDIILV